MTKDTESGSVDVSQEAPPSELTQDSSVQRTSIDAVKLQSTVETLIRDVDEIKTGFRTFQGGKDKGTKDLTTKVNELTSIISNYEELKAKGLNMDEAVGQMELQQFMTETRQTLSQLLPAKPVAGSSGGGVTESARVVKELNLDAADPEVVTLLGRNLPAVDLAIEAGKLAAHKATLPNPTEAQRSAVLGKPPVGARSAEVIVAELEAERLVNPFSKRRKELSKELQEVGG